MCPSFCSSDEKMYLIPRDTQNKGKNLGTISPSALETPDVPASLYHRHQNIWYRFSFRPGDSGRACSFLSQTKEHLGIVRRPSVTGTPDIPDSSCS